MLGLDETVGEFCEGAAAVDGDDVGARLHHVVDPQIGSAVPEFTVTRVARGATYEIHVSTGPIAGTSVDGEPLDGHLIPYAPAGSTVHVEVTVSTGAED